VFVNNNGITNTKNRDDDWFQHFPSWAQSTDCVVLAGQGATSTLHRDPFEWTGTSICLEGTKVWRFLEPFNAENGGVKQMDDLLKAYRLPSTAWRDGDVALSAGWQSDYNLYKTRKQSIPSALEWQDIQSNRKLAAMLQVALSPEQLTPNVDIPGAVWTAVQSPGDMLVIPAHWWHQTYGLEPSLAVSSQRCSNSDARRVLEHVLDTTGVHDIDLDAFFDHSDPKKCVRTFFLLLGEKLGTCL
jgi:Cupin-like domain